jgi:hypothetical protein
MTYTSSLHPQLTKKHNSFLCLPNAKQHKKPNKIPCSLPCNKNHQKGTNEIFFLSIRASIFCYIKIHFKMSNNTTVTELSSLDDPVFYVYVLGAVFSAPAILLQTVLLIQIRLHKLYNELSANLLFNIGCWWLLLLLGLCMGGFLEC